ncbi:MAG: hypothetical protein R2834_11565 [Rhodothermales bacterium]
MRYLVWIALLVLAPAAVAQDAYIGSAPRPVRITTGAVYQQYADADSRLQQVSFPVTAFVPVSRPFAVSLSFSPALSSGEEVVSLGGLSDAQLAVSYYQRLGAASAVFSLSANLPSGKRGLTQDEFATSTLLSQNFYGFRLPVFGQGLNLSPGVTLAFPAGDQAVVGIGASYQYRGGFEPLVDMTETFKPGDEILLTGGADVRLSDSWALSGDVTYTLYQADRLGDAEVFETGDQIAVSIQTLGNLGFNQLRFFARYRNKGKSTLPVEGLAITAPRTEPSQGRLLATYRVRVLQTVYATLIAQGRYFEETDLFGAKTLFDVGAGQEFVLTREVSLTSRFVYTFGSFPGVEIGGGLAFTL